jgi:PmbA protein
MVTMVSERHDAASLASVLDQVLGRVDQGDAEVVVIARDASLTRFANSQIHQNVAEHDTTLRLRLTHDGRTGVASTNRLDEEGIGRVVDQARTIRDRAARNPEAAPLASAEPTPHATLGFVPATADADPERRAAGARAVIAAADHSGLTASGAFSTEVQTMAVANTRGLRSSESATQAKLVTVVMDGQGGSGYAQSLSSDIGDVDGASVGAEAVDKGVRSARADDLEPGDYTAVLEEYAVAGLLEYLSYVGFSALAAQEDRSFMELGAQVMGENVSIWDDGQDPQGTPATIDFEGVAKQRVDLVTRGVATGLVHDTSTAAREGRTSTGHGLPAPNTWGPMAWNLFMAPGTASRDDLLRGIGRGLWVTRFHYINIVHAKRAILTGMTKDGTFLVEDGRVVRPIRNFRFTQSIPEAFSRISAIGSQTRLVGAEYSGINARVPAILVDQFAFTGATAAEEGG